MLDLIGYDAMLGHVPDIAIRALRPDNLSPCHGRLGEGVIIEYNPSSGLSIVKTRG